MVEDQSETLANTEDYDAKHVKFRSEKKKVETSSKVFPVCFCYLGGWSNK